MAESVAERKARLRKEPQWGGATGKEPPPQEGTSTKENVQKQTPPQPSQVMGRKPPTGGEHISYQKHVAFAIVTAFLIKLVASGKQFPTH
jgi:hypothetical protein